MRTWGVASAKSRFSEVVEQAETTGPQEITRNGKPVAVLVSKQAWEQKARPTPSQNARTTADFFRRSPLRGSGIDLKRSRSAPRKVTL